MASGKSRQCQNEEATENQNVELFKDIEGCTVTRRHIRVDKFGKKAILDIS